MSAEESKPLEPGTSQPAAAEPIESAAAYTIDTRYPRSLEGIVRIISLPVAIVGVILAVITYDSPAGWWFFFVGITFIVYIVIVFVIEIFVPNTYVHRLIDAIVTFCYAALWLLAAIIATSFAAKDADLLLGIAALFGYVLCGLAVLSGVLALRTWIQYEGGRRGSQPLLII